MQKRYAMMAICAGSLVWAAEWPTDGGNPQRTAWQQNEKILAKDNVKNLKVLWKLQLDNKPQEMHSLFAPLLVENIKTSSGPKEIAIVAGISDNIYAIDVATGKLLWKKHFEYRSHRAAWQAGRSACALPDRPPLPPSALRNASGDRTIYALAGDGQLHSLNVANGEDVMAPFPFGYPNGKHYSLNLWNDVIFTTTSQGCAGNPNQMWAVNLKDPDKKVMTFNPKSGGLVGTERSGHRFHRNGLGSHRRRPLRSRQPGLRQRTDRRARRRQ